MLFRSYGIEKLNFLLMKSGLDKIRGFTGNLSSEEIKLLKREINLEIVGSYLAKEEQDGIRLSFDAPNLLKPEKNIVEIEKYESGEAGNVLKMEGIEYGKNEMLAFAAVQKRAESEEFFTEENIVIAVSREISSKQNESYIIEKIPGTLEGFKRVMGLK